MHIKKQEYFALIPESVLFNEHLTSTSKLLWGVIYSLARKNGYCWATNRFLGKTLKSSSSTISRSIKALKDSGYISVFVNTDKRTKKVISRQITTSINIKNINDELTDPRLDENYSDYDLDFE